MIGKQTEHVLNSRGHIYLRSVVMTLDRDEGLDGGYTCCALVTLPPAPTSGTDYSGIVDEDDLARLGVRLDVASQVGEPFIAFGESDRGCAGYPSLIEHRHRQAVPDADQVGDVDQEVDRRDVPLLGQTTQ